MRISRLYVRDKLAEMAHLPLSTEASHYLIQVLRLDAGDKLAVFNNHWGEFLAEIIEPHRKKTIVEIKEQTHPPKELTFSCHLGLGLSKGDRMDVAIQKATELGVAAVTPLITQYSEFKFPTEQRKLKKLAHWANIAVSAAEQCGRLSVPEIHSPIELSQWVNLSTQGLKLMPTPRAKIGFSSLEMAKDCALLVGPEGGFSADEETIAVAAGFSLLNLGERILRTETAPLAALAILQFQFGDIH